MEQSQGKKPSRWGHKRLACVALVACVLLVEPACRLVWNNREKVRSVIGLDRLFFKHPFVEMDRQGRWRLKAGYAITVGQMLAESRRLGNAPMEQRVLEVQKRLGLAETDLVMSINRDGFRGPELDPRRARPRILTLGDSCTFGMHSFWLAFEQCTYPRALERELRARGKEVEVVNGGVPGYGTAAVLHALDRFKRLKPEITTLYVGWNDIFFLDEDDREEGLGKHLYTVRLLTRLYHRIRLRVAPHGELARRMGEAKVPDRDSPEVKALDGYKPRFAQTVARIVRELQASGSKVVLLTLPCLYVMDEPAADLSKGFLPSYTNNPYVLAKRVETYNEALRGIARDSGARLVDLERWSRDALTPRGRYFSDSHHLYDEGLEKVGRQIAAEIADLLHP